MDAGPAAAIARRAADVAGPGEVLASGTVRDLVASSAIAFAARGIYAIEGAPGRWELFAVVSP